MGKALGTILSIAVAIFAPYAAAALGLTGFAATAFGFVAQGLVGMLVNKSSLFGGGNQSGAGSTGDQGLLVNQQATTSPVYVIYGERRIGGNRVFIDTTNATGGQTGDDRDKYLHEVFSISEGEIGWINAMWFQDRVAWIHPSILALPAADNPYYQADLADDPGLSYSDWKSGVSVGENEEQKYWGFDLTSGRNKFYEHDGTPLFNFKFWRGADNQQSSSAWYETDTGTDWMSDLWLNKNRDGKKLAWCYLRLHYNRDKFSGAPTVQFDVLGKRVADTRNSLALPRNDTYANTYADLLTYVNPANCLRDYLTDPLYGKGLDVNLIDEASFTGLANYAHSKGLEVNGVVNPEATIFDNTDRLLNTANAFIVNSQGRYVVNHLDELDYTGAFNFNPDNILGEWNIALGSKKNMMNRVKVNWFNPAEEWQADIYTYPEDDATNPYLAADSGVLNEKTLDLPMVSVERQAQAMGEFILKLSRYQDIVNFKTTWAALKLDVGDPVTITHPTPGWTNKRFRLLSMSLQQDGTVDVVMIEYPEDDIWLPDVTYT